MGVIACYGLIHAPCPAMLPALRLATVEVLVASWQLGLGDAAAGSGTCHSLMNGSELKGPPGFI